METIEIRLGYRQKRQRNAVALGRKGRAGCGDGFQYLAASPFATAKRGNRQETGCADAMISLSKHGEQGMEMGPASLQPLSASPSAWRAEVRQMEAIDNREKDRPRGSRWFRQNPQFTPARQIHVPGWPVYTDSRCRRMSTVAAAMGHQFHWPNQSYPHNVYGLLGRDAPALAGPDNRNFPAPHFDVQTLGLLTRRSMVGLRSRVHGVCRLVRGNLCRASVALNLLCPVPGRRQARSSSGAHKPYLLVVGAPILFTRIRGIVQTCKPGILRADWRSAAVSIGTFCFSLVLLLQFPHFPAPGRCRHAVVS